MSFQKGLHYGKSLTVSSIENFSEGIHLKMYLIRDKRDVCKVAGIVFCCPKDANKFKHIFDHLQVQNEHFGHKNGDFETINGQ